MALTRSLFRPALLWPLLLLAVLLLYLFGLGGPYAPANGDEMVYIHIARMTAESGHWLPLAEQGWKPGGVMVSRWLNSLLFYPQRLWQ